MERKDVTSKLTQIKAAIAKIESNDDVVLYITKNKHLETVGYIHEIDTIADLIKAHHTIKKRSTNDYTESAVALGLAPEEIPESETKILGFKPAHWFTDINTRLAVLRTEKRYNALKAAEAALTKHMTNDDKFAMDTDGIDALLA